MLKVTFRSRGKGVFTNHHLQWPRGQQLQRRQWHRQTRFAPCLEPDHDTIYCHNKTRGTNQAKSFTNTQNSRRSNYGNNPLHYVQPARRARGARREGMPRPEQTALMLPRVELLPTKWKDSTPQGRQRCVQRPSGTLTVVSKQNVVVKKGKK
jgi:hypothetical protein